VAGCLFALTGCGGSTGSTTASSSTPSNTGPICGSPTVRQGAPTVIVLVLDGVGSEERGGTFHPLPGSGAKSVSSYCPVDPAHHETRWPAGLDDALRRWSEFSVPGGSSGGSSTAAGTSAACQWPGVKTDSCLIATLADAGAVVLPYSYSTGTGLKRPSGVPTFTMTPYTADDTKQPIATSVAALDAEIGSVRAVWPTTPIVLVGHSYGGLVAEEWWEQAWTTGDHQGVAHVFSLDSPINGVFQCTLSAAAQGSNVSDEFCRRRASLTGDRAIDENIITLAADHSYTAVGNIDDPTYRGVPVSGGGGIEDQVVYKCGDRGDTNTVCIASPPSLVINSNPADGSCKEGSPTLYGTTGHDIVKACPTVVRAIRAAVFAASAHPIPPPTPTPAVSNDPLTAGVAELFTYLNSRERIGLPPDRGAGFTVISHIVDRTTVAGHPLGAADIAQASGSNAHVIAQFVEPLAVESDAAPGSTIVHNFTGQFELENISATYSDEGVSPADQANGVSAQGSVNISYIDRARASASARWSEWTDDSTTVSVRIVHGKPSTNLLGWPPSTVGPVVQAECTRMRSPDCIAITDTSP
jgi:hypothetical protein